LNESVVSNNLPPTQFNDSIWVSTGWQASFAGSNINNVYNMEPLPPGLTPRIRVTVSVPAAHFSSGANYGSNTARQLPGLTTANNIGGPSYLDAPDTIHFTHIYAQVQSVTSTVSTQDVIFSVEREFVEITPPQINYNLPIQTFSSCYIPSLSTGTTNPLSATTFLASASANSIVFVGQMASITLESRAPVKLGWDYVGTLIQPQERCYKFDPTIAPGSPGGIPPYWDVSLYRFQGGLMLSGNINSYSPLILDNGTVFAQQFQNNVPGFTPPGVNNNAGGMIGWVPTWFLPTRDERASMDKRITKVEITVPKLYEEGVNGPARVVRMSSLDSSQTIQMTGQILCQARAEGKVVPYTSRNNSLYTVINPSVVTLASLLMSCSQCPLRDIYPMNGKQGWLAFKENEVDKWTGPKDLIKYIQQSAPEVIRIAASAGFFGRHSLTNYLPTSSAGEFGRHKRARSGDGDDNECQSGGLFDSLRRVAEHAAPYAGQIGAQIAGRLAGSDGMFGTSHETQSDGFFDTLGSLARTYGPLAAQLASSAEGQFGTDSEGQFGTGSEGQFGTDSEGQFGADSAESAGQFRVVRNAQTGHARLAQSSGTVNLPRGSVISSADIFHFATQVWRKSESIGNAELQGVAAELLESVNIQDNVMMWAPNRVAQFFINVNRVIASSQGTGNIPFAGATQFQNGVHPFNGVASLAGILESIERLTVDEKVRCLASFVMTNGGLEVKSLPADPMNLFFTTAAREFYREHTKLGGRALTLAVSDFYYYYFSQARIVRLSIQHVNRGWRFDRAFVGLPCAIAVGEHDWTLMRVNKYKALEYAEKVQRLRAALKQQGLSYMDPTSVFGKKMGGAITEAMRAVERGVQQGKSAEKLSRSQKIGWLHQQQRSSASSMREIPTQVPRRGASAASVPAHGGSFVTIGNPIPRQDTMVVQPSGPDMAAASSSAFPDFFGST